MRGIVIASTQDAGRLLQFGVIRVGKVYRTVADIPKGYMGTLLEVRSEGIKQHLLSKEDCYTVAVPLSVDGEKVIYGPVYATTNSVLLRTDVTV